MEVRHSLKKLMIDRCTHFFGQCFAHASLAVGVIEYFLELHASTFFENQVDMFAILGDIVDLHNTRVINKS